MMAITMTTGTEESCHEPATKSYRRRRFLVFLLPRWPVNRPSRAVAAVPEFVGKRRARRAPAGVGPGLGRVGGLVEQQDFGEVVAEARPGLFVGSRDRSRGADGDSGRLR